jgi:HD superfamily phosphohydrolase
MRSANFITGIIFTRLTSTTDKTCLLSTITPPSTKKISLLLPKSFYMPAKGINKLKIINDPVHGFIRIPSEFIFDLLEHPFFQRLRRIKQLGLTYYVYPGATHTRFQHALGAVHLMTQAISVLRQKGTEISDEEEEGAYIAILLHDIGHGPFSHALEHSLIHDISHEDVSNLLMQKLNEEFDGRLNLALDIFNNKYKKKFLYQLVSSQLDMDRMDYLKRDSFFTGVTEGNIGADRIIKMLKVVDDQLAIEAKGIYSIEKFLIARRLMYWQVYYHKTVIASEFILVKTLQRASELALSGEEVYGTPALSYFLNKRIDPSELKTNKERVIKNFIELDDTDILVSAKQWVNHSDKLLSILAGGIINRQLPKVEISNTVFDEQTIINCQNKISKHFNLSGQNPAYLVDTDVISNSAYTDKADKINISFNNGDLKDIAEVSDVLNISYLNDTVEKHYICYPKLPDSE